MKEESNRLKKINKLIKEKVGEYILKEIELPPDCFVTISRADTHRDLKNTKIFISIIPFDQKEEIFRKLNSNLYKIQSDLSKYLQMRNTPKISLELDTQEENADKINKLLDEIKDEL